MLSGLENPIHLLFILAILLMVFGAKRLPEMGKSLGTGLRGFRDSISGAGHEATALSSVSASGTVADPRSEPLS